jgi:hypothetical protein
MLLMWFVGSQAVLGLLFFSPSAAALCRGTPDPTLGFPGRPAGRPGTQPGPDPGPVLRGDVPGFLRSMFAWTGRAGTRPGTGPGPRAGPGPEPARTTGVSTTGRGGGCGASRLRDAGLRPHCSHPPGSFCCCVCLAWCVCCCSCAGPRSRPGSGGGRAASTPSRGSLGALWRQAASAALGSGPFSLLRAVRWPGRVPARRAVGFIAGRSRWA